MKTIKLVSITLMLAIFVVTPFVFQSCAPESGEVGPQGAKGDKGEKGEKGDAGAVGAAGVAGAAGATGATGAAGNANVTQYTFGGKTWAGTSGATVTLTLNGVSADAASKSAYFTYIKNGSLWYQVPGEVDIYGEFRTYISPSANSVVYIKRVGTGTALTAEGVRVVLIPANNLLNGRVAHIDYSKYEEVKRYYNLPD